MQARCQRRQNESDGEISCTVYIHVNVMHSRSQELPGHPMKNLMKS